MSRFRFPAPAILLAVAFAATALVLTNLSAVPVYQSRPRTITETLGGPKTTAPNPFQTVGGGSNTIVSGGGGVQCTGGRNGGSTDTGVTPTLIKLGATVVRSGLGSAFLGGAPVSMQALVNRVNREGGVCGRLLDLRMVDDGWDRSRGVTFLRSLIADGVFALAVSPSSEGVDSIIASGELRKDAVPLVGADGMVKSMYGDPWVWPVAASTVSNMHIMVQEAYKRGFRSFGIVFDKEYHFGVEGAYAYDQTVKRLTGHDIPGYDSGLDKCQGTFCGIRAGQPSYPEVSTFNSACDQAHPGGPFPSHAESCDLIALLLEPKTALTWLANGGLNPGFGRVHGPQPLFNTDFAKSCGQDCTEMVAWTSYNPPLAPFANDPAVRDYVNAVRRVSPSLDVSNSFTEGAYLGLEALVGALRLLGTNVTRAGLRDVLNTRTFDLGLSPPLRWATGDRHLGSGMMQSYQFQYSGNTFTGFQLQQGYVRDRYLGLDL